MQESNKYYQGCLLSESEHNCYYSVSKGEKK